MPKNNPRLQWESYQAHFGFLFWVTTRIDLNALVLKKHIGFVILCSSASLYSLSDWSAVLAPVSLIYKYKMYKYKTLKEMK